MDDAETINADTIKKDTEQLDNLEKEIQAARRDVDEDALKKEERGPKFFEDDQEEPEEGPGNNNVPA